MAQLKWSTLRCFPTIQTKMYLVTAGTNYTISPHRLDVNVMVNCSKVQGQLLQKQWSS